MPYAVPWRRLDLRHTCAINVTLLGLSLLISTSPALETIQDAVLVSLNWTGGITSADVKPSLARFMHIHMDGAYRSNSLFFCIHAHARIQSDPENPYAETLMRKEKCAQCMTDPWKVP